MHSEHTWRLSLPHRSTMSTRQIHVLVMLDAGELETRDSQI